KEVTIEVSEQGPYKVVSHEHTGAYHLIAPVILDVEKWAKANGESCRFSFGEFLDDPKVVDEDRLKSSGGCVVEKDWSTGLPAGHVYREISRRTYLVAKFDGAPGIGPMKVYPRAMRAIEERGKKLEGPVIEMYEVLPGDQVITTYLFPIQP
ncbi:MAG: GyrI-like domain-containing protein, partial [Bdellovibrionota bacterium]